MTDEEKYELEQELQDVETELQMLYDLQRERWPLPDEHTTGIIYDLQDRRTEIKKLLQDDDLPAASPA